MMPAPPLSPRLDLLSVLHPVDPPGDERRWPTVVNRDQHLIHTIGGAGVATVDGQIVAMQPGQVLRIPPHREYQIQPDFAQGLEMVNMHYHLHHDGGRLPLVFSLPDPAAARRELLALHAQWLAGDGLGALATFAARLAAYHARVGQSAPPPPVDAAMARLRGWIAANPGSYDAVSWAGRLGLSASQMNRRFRQAYGQAPSELAGEIRLRDAQAMLHGTDLTIGEIAARVGFADANYFSRWFRDRSGVSPSAYQRARAHGQR